MSQYKSFKPEHIELHTVQSLMVDEGITITVVYGDCGLWNGFCNNGFHLRFKIIDAQLDFYTIAGEGPRQ